MQTTLKFIIGFSLRPVVVTIALLPWMDSWGATPDETAASFTGDELVPSPRLLLRSRSSLEGWLWDVMRPGGFIMVRGMLWGIKERAEGALGR